jgi:hypothetical protein
LITIYQELDLHEMIVDWESPELDLDSFSAKEFIAVFGAKNPDLYRLDEEEFTDVAELGSIEDEAIADLVSAEVEVKSSRTKQQDGESTPTPSTRVS